LQPQSQKPTLIDIHSRDKLHAVATQQLFLHQSRKVNDIEKFHLSLTLFLNTRCPVNSSDSKPKPDLIHRKIEFDHFVVSVKQIELLNATDQSA
jgi:hypothetical protein